MFSENNLYRLSASYLNGNGSCHYWSRDLEIFSVNNIIKKQKQNILKKKSSIKIIIKKFLIVSFHNDIKPIPDIVARSRDRPSSPDFCELDQLLSEIL